MIVFHLKGSEGDEGEVPRTPQSYHKESTNSSLMANTWIDFLIFKSGAWTNILDIQVMAVMVPLTLTRISHYQQQ